MLRRDGAPVLEIRFHAEHTDAARSEAVLSRLTAAKRGWRRTLAGPGPFLGRAGGWRRASETWDAADLSDPGAAVEAADRLAEYIAAFEPLGDATPPSRRRRHDEGWRTYARRRRQPGSPSR